VLGLVLLVAVVVDIVSKNGASSLPFLSHLKGKKEKVSDAVKPAKA